MNITEIKDKKIKLQASILLKMSLMYLSYQVIALDQMRNDSKKWFYE